MAEEERHSPTWAEKNDANLPRELLCLEQLLNA
jgi:hypothetical protein